jgi:Lrp/AsnC family leucine-responsive transcriptional regulator
MADELDNIALRILDLLAADGRMSYQAIADEVGLSRPAVMERVKRLEESGHIRGYAAILDRARVGFPITAFVAVRYPASTGALDDAGISSPAIPCSSAIMSPATTATC